MFGYGPWRRRHSTEEGLIALLIMLLINIIALPILGLAYVCDGNESTNAKGWIMLISGIAIWIFILCNIGS